MSYIAPYARIKAFLGLADENVQSRPLEINFDDLLDVIRVLLSAIPVDETWYVNKYQDVGAFIGRGSFLNSGSHHFNVLGYFEGRRPFEHDTGPQRLPSTFAELKRLIAVSPVRERLVARVDYKVLLQMIRHLLVAVPVDEPWYQDHYPDVTAAIEDGRLRSAADHFARDGYFEGRWPFDMPVDESGTLPPIPMCGTPARERILHPAPTTFIARVTSKAACRLPMLSLLFTGSSDGLHQPEPRALREDHNGLAFGGAICSRALSLRAGSSGRPRR